ncbi:autotransporter outer membrane beta-barrel domain-containing protein [Luteibacter aegosomatissinici]|uniref:autotransporter outer membrane beta-barrel domain-containing protein n=1 Tax=Luteibacter aegosomatissinici TaxID=2911539 RepID=UPI001FFB1FBC|nr:autotransporter outer membrane beta-barrel domain-containing protein [Luteibacter aegosomatissinici]UPG96419.1 autotransporter outer membrane beta-barrel domain-containing protein [Luteibacter aegosomatissinici]
MKSDRSHGRMRHLDLRKPQLDGVRTDHEVKMKGKGVGLVLKSSVVILGAAVVEGRLQAKTVGTDQSVVVSGTGHPVDLWELSSGSSLTLSEGARAEYVNMYRARLFMEDAILTSSNGAGVSAQLRSEVDLLRSAVHDSVGVGLLLTGNLDSTPEGRSTARIVESRVDGAIAGVAVSDHGRVTALRSTIAATGDEGVGLLLTSGDVLLDDGTTVKGSEAGAAMGYDHRLAAGATRLVVANKSSVTAVTGPAIVVTGHGGDVHAAEIFVRDGATVRSGGGVALGARNGARVTFGIDRAEVIGDVLVSSDSSARVRVGRGGVLRGSAQGPVNVSLGRAGHWFVRGDSQISELVFEGGGLELDCGVGAARSLRVNGNVTGTAGAVGLNVHMNAESPSSTWSDSLVVRGDVDVSRPIDLVVNVTGTPFNTDANADGRASASEGVSLVQVGGKSSADAFRLRDQFVALGAFQYQLKAFAGAEVEQAGSESDTSPPAWDYRLVSRVVCESECEGPPSGSGGGPGGDSGRPAVAPEIASYVSVPAMVFAYSDGSVTSLHERLGEIRDHAFEGDVGGEMFARFTGKRQRYSSDRSFKGYGYDFDHAVEAWQFGGSLVGLDGDNGSLRAGWAFDHGRSTVVPHAVDGDSVTRLKSNGTSAWVTWRSGDGFWLDWVVSRQRMHGQTDTAAGGPGIGRLRATSTGISMGAGLPIHIGGQWHVEPHITMSTQGVRIDPIHQGNGTLVRFGGGRYRTGALGVAISRQDDRFSPFARIDVRSTSGNGILLAGTEGLAASRFDGGRNGSEALVAGGLTAQLTSRVQAFGETGYRHYLGRGGFQGWSGNVGMRVTF